MKSQFLHVTVQGATLSQTGRRLVVQSDGQPPTSVPTIHLSGVILYGDVRPTRGAIRLCFEEGVSLSYLTRHGRLLGHLVSQRNSGAALRLHQLERRQDPAFCLSWAKAIVDAKFDAALETLLSRKRALSAQSRQAADLIARQRVSAGNARSIEQIRGFEGVAARAWFAIVREWLGPGLNFPARDRKSPDPMNALLNLSYTLVCQELEGLASAAGLDPALGYYHENHDGRPSLACDWMEPYRTGFVDGFVLSLLNRKQIQTADFESRPSIGLRLAKAALNRFIASYEEAVVPHRTKWQRQMPLLIAVIERESAPVTIFAGPKGAE